MHEPPTLDPQLVITLTAPEENSRQKRDSSFIATNTATPHSPKNLAAMVDTTKRLNSELRSKFSELRESCVELKDTQLHDISTALLKDFATRMVDLVEECETLVSSLPERVAEMIVGDERRSNNTVSHVASKLMRHSFIRRASQVSSSRAAGPTAGVVPPTAPPTPRSSGANPNPRLPTNLLPDTPGKPSSALVQPTEAASEKMLTLARGLYLTLESATRALGAEKALLCVPNRGVKDDLRVVAHCGFDATAPEHRNKDGRSIEFASFQSKFLINCTSGTNPPFEIDYDGVLHYFEDALSESAPAAAGASTDISLNGGGGLAKDISLSATAKFVAIHAGGGGRKSSYWSKLYCPVRRDTSSPPFGVIAFLQKERGSSNFTSDDEHLAFGTATVIAAMLQRCSDFELLSRCSDQVVSSLPPLTTPPSSIASNLTPGSRSQLVYRTNDQNGPKDIKILVGESTTAERLDTHTPLLHIAQYIGRLQESWRNAVLLNSQLAKTHEDRTRVVTALLARARVSEFRNEALMSERIAAIPHNRKPLFQKPKPQQHDLQHEAPDQQEPQQEGGRDPEASEHLNISGFTHRECHRPESSDEVSSGDPNDDDVYSVDRNESHSDDGEKDDEDESEEGPVMSTSDQAKLLLFGNPTVAMQRRLQSPKGTPVESPTAE